MRWRGQLTYFKAIQNDSYFFSVDELLILAECANVSLVVCRFRGGRFVAEGWTAAGHAGAPVAMCYLRGDSRRAMRGHFERLCPASTKVQAEAAVHEAAAAAEAQRVAEAEARRKEAMARAGSRGNRHTKHARGTVADICMCACV